MSADLADLRAGFVELLERGGQVDSSWVSAVRSTPRDLFVPHFFRHRTDGPGWRIVERDDSEWARSVLANTPLITQLNGDDTAVEHLRAGQRVTGWATSSSSQPSLMLLMLRAAGIRPGQRVLEVGTGTGYNAALICHHIGGDNLVSIDIDSTIVETARDRLSRLDQYPHLVVGDGTKGCSDRAPFDRIIATVALRRVPTQWIEQVRDGGRILFPLDTRNGGGIMPILAVADGRAHGHFLPEFGGFMPVREQPRSDAASTAFMAHNPDEVPATVTELGHEVVTDDSHPCQFFVALFTGGIDVLTFTPRAGGAVQTWLAMPDGSWACHRRDGDVHRVHQGGPRRLWDRVEQLHQKWTDLGEPVRQRFGLTVEQQVHEIWLDHPGATHRWPLPDL